MAHLVPVPPPVNFRVPTLTKFSVIAADGVGEIFAWGANDPAFVWRVGTDNDWEVVSTLYRYDSYPELQFFKLEGARKGMKLAIFKRDPTGTVWTRWSDYAEVEANAGDKYAGLATGALPQSKFSKNISFYPFGSMQAAQPLTEVEWIAKVESALEKLSNNVIGQSVLKNTPNGTVIYPYLPPDKNAYSDVHINPAQWSDDFRPGARIDEVIMHELIHRIDGCGSYQNRYGFMFDGSDFLTVNATNVYSCMLGRGLRKDHHDFLSLPEEHFKNPELHFQQQDSNYQIAASHAWDLVRTLAKVDGVWNPFKYWASNFALSGMAGGGF